MATTTTGTTGSSDMVLSDYFAKKTAEAETKNYAKSDNGSIDKDGFLNLLVTQLRYQDPMNPSDNQQMAAQMAQFTALEQTQNMAASLEKMTTTIQGMVDNQNKSSLTMSSSSATSLMGKTVRLRQTEAVLASTTKGMTFNVSAPSNSQVDLLDKNDKVVATLHLDGFNGDGSKILDENGDGEITWDGKGIDGKSVALGTYKIAVRDSTTGEASGSAWTDAVVSGVEFDTEGPKLIAGGQAYTMQDLLAISGS